MIDRIGSSTHGFSENARQIIRTAERLSERLRYPLIPEHIAFSLVTHFTDTFGDRTTQRMAKRTLLDWRIAADPGEDRLFTLLSIAQEKAGSENRKPIRGIDLLYAVLTPDMDSPQVAAFSFFAGDQQSPLSYREAVYLRAGGRLDNAHYGSSAHKIVRLAERFTTLIPPSLLDQAGNNIPPSEAFMPETKIPRLAPGVIEISGRRTGQPTRRFVLA